MMKRIGARAHDYGNLPAEELAAKLASHGYCCTQLALNIAIKGLALEAGAAEPGFGVADRSGLPEQRRSDCDSGLLHQPDQHGRDDPPQ